MVRRRRGQLGLLKPPTKHMRRRLRPLILLLAEPVRRRVAGAKLRKDVGDRLASAFRCLAPAAEQLPAFDSLGLPIADIESACARYSFDELVQRIPGRGNTAAHLHLIAWHGSALADIGCPPEHPLRRRLLLDAALFNLAVALTDSLVDDDPPAGARAARVLSPQKLERRLHAPEDDGAAIPAGEDGLDLLYRLWDGLLVSIGERFAADPEALAHISTMLAQMHRGEFDVGADRLPAKVLPIAFVGALLRGRGHERRRGHGSTRRARSALPRARTTTRAQRRLA